MDCIQWWASKDSKGYGQTKRSIVSGRKTRQAHRVIYAECFGDPDPSLEIDHICNNPSCVNPLHLQLVTHKKNCELRGKRRTHCKRGHERNNLNQYVSPNGKTYCKPCAAIRAKTKRSQKHGK